MIIAPIRFAKTQPDAIIPIYAHPGDSGLDAYVPTHAEYVIPPGSTGLVGLGIAVELPCLDAPLQLELVVRPRSGLSLRSSIRIANAPGTIDAGYRGEIKVVVDNRGDYLLHVRHGLKICQLVPNVIYRAQVVEVPFAHLSETQRQASGFGSTGQTTTGNEIDPLGC